VCFSSLEWKAAKIQRSQRRDSAAGRPGHYHLHHSTRPSPTTAFPDYSDTNPEIRNHGKPPLKDPYQTSDPSHDPQNGDDSGKASGRKTPPHLQHLHDHLLSIIHSVQASPRSSDGDDSGKSSGHVRFPDQPKRGNKGSSERHLANKGGNNRKQSTLHDLGTSKFYSLALDRPQYRDDDGSFTDSQHHHVIKGPASVLSDVDVQVEVEPADVVTNSEQSSDIYADFDTDEKDDDGDHGDDGVQAQAEQLNQAEQDQFDDDHQELDFNQDSYPKGSDTNLCTCYFCFLINFWH
jgi:hypothetical protein